MTTEPPPTYTVDAQEVAEGTAPTLVQPQIQIVPIGQHEFNDRITERASKRTTYAY